MSLNTSLHYTAHCVTYENDTKLSSEKTDRDNLISCPQSAVASCCTTLRHFWDEHRLQRSEHWYEKCTSSRNFQHRRISNTIHNRNQCYNNNNNKYGQLAQSYTFIPVAVETLGPINNAGLEFVSDLGRRISQVSNDHRASALLFQRLSVLVQRFNAVDIYKGTFAHTANGDEI